MVFIDTIPFLAQSCRELNRVDGHCCLPREEGSWLCRFHNAPPFLASAECSSTEYGFSFKAPVCCPHIFWLFLTLNCPAGLAETSLVSSQIGERTAAAFPSCGASVRRLRLPISLVVCEKADRSELELAAPSQRRMVAGMKLNGCAGNPPPPVARSSFPATTPICRALAMACLIAAAGCAGVPDRGDRTHRQAAALGERLRRLDVSVDAGEAARLAATSVEDAASLAREYRAVRPAWIHNWLVNAGWRERGLCYEWANDLFPRLHSLNLRTLELHLAVARMDTRREHNCIVVTARGQAFENGVVLDAWRHAGRIWFGDVATDKYPWRPLPRDRVAPELETLFER